MQRIQVKKEFIFSWKINILEKHKAPDNLLNEALKRALQLLIYSHLGARDILKKSKQQKDFTGNFKKIKELWQKI